MQVKANYNKQEKQEVLTNQINAKKSKHTHTHTHTHTYIYIYIKLQIVQKP